MPKASQNLLTNTSLLISVKLVPKLTATQIASIRVVTIVITVVGVVSTLVHV